MDQLKRPASLATKQTTRPRGGGGVFPHALTATELGDDVVEVFLRAEPFRSSTSTIAAMSHMSETVASSMDMVSRVGQLLFMRS